jgi:hypothetical protein
VPTLTKVASLGADKSERELDMANADDGACIRVRIVIFAAATATQQAMVMMRVRLA